MLALVLASCAPSADDPVNHQSEWRSPTNDYVVRYLEPPWELDRELTDGVVLRIPSNAMTVGGIEGGPNKFELTVVRETGIPPVRMDAQRATYAAAGHEILVEPRMITTQEGAAGLDMVTRRTGERLVFNHRVAYFAFDPARVLRLEVVGTANVDTAEVTEMFRLVGIGPEAP